MGNLVVNTLPYAFAAALAAPIVAVVTALILARSRPPLLAAWTFTAAAGAIDAAIAAILLVAFWGSAGDASGNAGAVIDLALGVLFITLGLAALVRRETPEQEVARRRRIDSFLARGLRGVVILGVIAQIVNFDAIAVFAGGLKEIVAEQPPAWQAAIATFVMLLVMLLPYYAPAVVYAFSPARAGKALTRMSDWLLDKSRQLEIIIGIGYGSLFLWKGLTAL